MPGFLLIQTASIGDVILITPVMEKLHSWYPDKTIDLLIKKGNESLFKNHPYIRTLYTWDKSKNKYLNLYALLQKARKAKYDRVINFQRFASTGLFTILSGAKATAGFNKNPFSGLFTSSANHAIDPLLNVHEVSRNQALIANLTDSTPLKPRLYPSQDDYDSIRRYITEKYICVAPASLWFTKQFPENRWIEFLSKLSGSYTVYLLGSSTDYPMCESIIAKSGLVNGINLAGKLSLLQSAALMQSARMNFVNDSSPMHLASSVNAPVTAIYCSTVPGYGFGPLSDVSMIIETKEKLSCRPCGLHGYESCPLKHFKCATSINIDELINCLPS